MSNRCFLTAGQRSRAKILAESKSVIPVLWLSLFSTADLKKSKQPGIYELDRKRAIANGERHLPFLASLYPQVRSVAEAGRSLLDLLNRSRAKTIGIDFSQVLPEVNEHGDRAPRLADAIDAIERRFADYSLTIPARIVKNPFTGEKKRTPQRRMATTQAMLAFTCAWGPRVFSTTDEDANRLALVGYLWDGSNQEKPSSDRAEAEETAADESDEDEDRIAELIRVHGWMSNRVAIVQQTFIHTIGIGQKYNHPEFCIIAMEENSAHAVIIELVKQIDSGTSFGKTCTHAVTVAGKEHLFAFRPVHSTLVTLPIFFGEAIAYYHRSERAEKLEIVQVFWPDSNGKFPFEPECDPAVCKEQGRFDISLAERTKAKE